MEIELRVTKKFNVAYLEIDSEPRYWEDAYINGVEDAEGKMPGSDGNSWKVIIDLETGKIDGWPEGVEASTHYKVCDAGQYYLLDSEKQRVAEYNHYYVPSSEFDGIGDDDYLIMTIKDGAVQGFGSHIDIAKWIAIEDL